MRPGRFDERRRLSPGGVGRLDQPEPVEPELTAMEWLAVGAATLLVLPWVVAWEVWKLGKAHVKESDERLSAVGAHLFTIDESLRGIRNTIGGIQYDISGNRVDAAGWMPSDPYLRREVRRLSAELDREQKEREREREERRELESRIADPAGWLPSDPHLRREVARLSAELAREREEREDSREMQRELDERWRPTLGGMSLSDKLGAIATALDQIIRALAGKDKR